MPNSISRAFYFVCDKLDIVNPYKDKGPVFSYSNWRKITVIKENDNYGASCNCLGIHFRVSRYDIYQDIIDTSTGEIYNLVCGFNGPIIKRFKAINFAIWTPLYMLATMGYHVLLLAFNVAKYVGKIFYHIAIHIVIKLVIKTDDSLKDDLLSDLQQLGQKVWYSVASIIRSPYYATMVFIGNLVTVVDPINGNKWVYLWEDAWNHKRFQRGAQELFIPIGGHIGEDWDFSKSTAVGFCYQPVDTIKNLYQNPSTVAAHFEETEHPFLHFLGLWAWGYNPDNMGLDSLEGYENVIYSNYLTKAVKTFQVRSSMSSGTLQRQLHQSLDDRETA